MANWVGSLLTPLLSTLLIINEDKVWALLSTLLISIIEKVRTLLSTLLIINEDKVRIILSRSPSFHFLFNYIIYQPNLPSIIVRRNGCMYQGRRRRG